MTQRFVQLEKSLLEKVESNSIQIIQEYTSKIIKLHNFLRHDTNKKKELFSMSDTLEESLFDDLLDHDTFIKMAPKRSYKKPIKIVKVKKAKPKIIEHEIL